MTATEAATGAEPIDTVTFEVLSSALLSAAEEMGAALKRSSYSPIIRDMDDFSCALFTAEGDLVAQADYIPAQLGAMSLVVKSVLERWGSGIADGDTFICNHPFLGAMHLPTSTSSARCSPAGAAGLGGHRCAPHRRRRRGPRHEGPDLQDIYAEGLMHPSGPALHRRP